MSFSAVNKSVRAMFKQGWTNGVKYVGDNEEALSNVKEWARLSIRPAISNQISMGAAKNTTRTNGVIIASIFVKTGESTIRAYELADQAVAALQYNKQVGDDWFVQTRAATVNDIGQNPGATYYQINVTVNYYSDRNA